MKIKYADYPNWKEVETKEYKNKYLKNEKFEGNISLLIAKKVIKKNFKVENGKKIKTFDDNFKWLEIYPEQNKNIALTACFNDKNEIMSWYFDIAKNSYLTEKGIPCIDDLYLDIMMYPSGKIEMLDEDELKQALEEKDITKEDYDLAYKVAEEIIENIEGKTNELTKFTEECFSFVNQ